MYDDPFSPADEELGLTDAESEPPFENIATPGVVTGNAKQYTVPMHYSRMQNPIFGDKIVNLGRQSADPEELALKRGYRTFPMRDIEIDPVKLGRAYISPKSRFCTARIERRNVTVSIRQGGDDEKRKWEEEVRELRGAFRHGINMQLFGVATVDNLYAVIYHGEFFYLPDYMTQVTPLLRAEIIYEWCLQYSNYDVAKIFNVTDFGNTRLESFLNPDNMRFRYQVEMNDRDREFNWGGPVIVGDNQWGWITTPMKSSRFHEAALEDIYTSCVTHMPERKCRHRWRQPNCGDLPAAAVITVPRQWRANAMPVAAATAHEGGRSVEETSQWSCGTMTRSGLHRCVAIVYSPELFTHFSVHLTPEIYCRRDGNGKSRIGHISVTIKRKREVALWACQAEHFLRKAGANCSQNYGPINYLELRVQVTMKPGMLDAFLFLPPSQLVFSPATVIPDIAYLSLTPDGSERLTREQAKSLNLPDIEIVVEFESTSYSDELYETIRAVHEARGFDPYSTEVAEHLKLPVLEFITPRKPRIAKLYFFDEHWEEGDSSILDLFRCDEDEDSVIADKVTRLAAYLAWIHLALIMLVFFMLERKI